jgi:hypothetical protein
MQRCQSELTHWVMCQTGLLLAACVTLKQTAVNSSLQARVFDLKCNYIWIVILRKYTRIKIAVLDHKLIGYLNINWCWSVRSTVRAGDGSFVQSFKARNSCK